MIRGFIDMPNRLAEERSLYLLQHADNPVDWYPWGDEAFDKALEENKPVLVSIGYSACHWCHVMAKESFQDDYVAEVMNRHFVCVKVDREERPDVDHVYVEAVQMFNQSAGWPLNVFCLPDGRPFWGGTYFPREDKGHGIVPWPQLLMRIADHFSRNREELLENADNVVKNLTHANNAQTGSPSDWSPGHLLGAARKLCESHDDEFGGFTPAPKFPSPMKIDFLVSLREASACSADEALSRRIDEVVPRTLSFMARGGIFDQVGGGFCRYSVDAQWKIPHFEKMLYDNALLLSTYARAYRRYRSTLFERVTEETIEWLLRDLRGSDNLFHASLDADSDGGEGRHYVWAPEEIAAVLPPEEASAFCEAYDVSPEGNFEGGASNPILLPEDDESRSSWSDARNKLLDARNLRPRPGRDDKELASWNALLVRGLTESSVSFGRKDWLALARDVADAILATHFSEDGSLHASRYPTEEAEGPAFLDDYAFLAEALLGLAAVVDWIDPGASAHYQEEAIRVTEAAMEYYRDSLLPGYFFTSREGEAPAGVRKKLWYDNAIPAGNSSLLRVFSTLRALTGEERWEQEFAEARAAYAKLAMRIPHGTGHALAALVEEAVGIAVISINGPSVDALVRVLASQPYRPVHLRAVEDPDARPGYALCVNKTCLPPTVDADAVTQALFE